MPTGKDTPFAFTVLMTTLCITLFAASPQLHGGFFHSSIESKVLCHFFHANVFHWLCNALCIWLMRPSPGQILSAMPFAVLAMFFTDTPTIGLSAVIYAYTGMNIVRWKVSLIDWTTFVVANLITLFIPGIAFGVHLAAFLMGMAWYMGIRKLKHILNDRY